MLVEFDRFIEFGDTWFGKEVKERSDLVFDKITINTKYVAWMRRFEIHGGFQLCELYMADRGGVVTVDRSYEDMKALLKVREAP